MNAVTELWIHKHPDFYFYCSIDVKQNYLRELKENGFIRVKHKSGEEITPDIGTKNLSDSPFEYHADKLVTSGKLVEQRKAKQKPR